MECESRVRLLEAENQYLSYQLKKQKKTHETEFSHLSSPQKRYVQLQRRYENATADLKRLSDKSFMNFVEKTKGKAKKSSYIDEVKSVLDEAVTSVCYQVVWMDYNESTIVEVEQLKRLVEQQRRDAEDSEEFHGLEHKALIDTLEQTQLQLKQAEKTDALAENHKVQEMELQVMEMQLQLEDQKRQEQVLLSAKLEVEKALALQKDDLSRQISNLQQELHRVRMQMERGKMELESAVTQFTEAEEALEFARNENRAQKEMHDHLLKQANADKAILQGQIDSLKTQLEASDRNSNGNYTDRVLQKYMVHQEQRIEAERMRTAVAS